MLLYSPHVHTMQASQIVDMMIKTNILHRMRLYIEIVGAKILFGQRL